MSRTTLLIFSVIIGAQAIPTPQLTPCKSDDSACNTKNANTVYKLSVTGIPELNIEPLDPLYQENVIGDFGIIKYEIRDSTIEGFKDCYIVNSKIELEKAKVQLSLVCPYYNIQGLYKISGQLLTMPIEGDGNYTIKAKDYHIDVDTDVKIENKNGKRYLSLKSYTLTADLRGGMDADLTNLFNGQKELGENVLKFINQNAKAVASLLQGPWFDYNVKKLMKNFNKFLKTVPIDQIFLE